MKGFMYWFDRALFAFAEYRAGITPRKWKAYKEFTQGEWDLGLCTKKEAIAQVTDKGAHSIRYLDIDEATIIYE